MSLNARRVRVLRLSNEKRYRRTTKNEKKKILDEFTAASGYHRKHAISILSCRGPDQGKKSRKSKSMRSRPHRIYTDDVRDTFITVWEA